jgi:hypothetical protein
VIARRAALTVALFAVFAAACGEAATSPAGTPEPQPTGGPDPTTFAAQVASTDLVVDVAERVQIGIFSSTQDEGVRLLTAGSIEVAFRPFEDVDGAPIERSATYVPAPGTEGTADGVPLLTTPDVGRGVYEADDVTFERAGIWQADVTFTVEGSPYGLSTQFQVHEEARIPAPGDRALRTENLTLDTATDAAALDSRAAHDGEVPDPDLHRWTIAEAIEARRPSLVLFSTPVFCQSQFCGPTVEALEAIADDRPDDAVYIHVEIWEDHAASRLNAAAAEWLLRDGDLSEPWLYLIDARGRIVDRWGPLFDPDDVRAALDGVATK